VASWLTLVALPPLGAILLRWPAPPPPCRPMTMDLVRRCFNYFRQDHVAADCTNATRCLQCHKEGHCACVCKRPHSPDTVGPPWWVACPAMVAVLHPRPGEVALGRPRLAPWGPKLARKSPALHRAGVSGRPVAPGVGRGESTVGRCSPTPPCCSGASTLDGSPSRHMLPSPPRPPSSPSPPPMRPPSQRPRFEMQIIPWNTAINTAEAQLEIALFAVVEGSRPAATPT
jgi:hypothetical protein